MLGQPVSMLIPRVVGFRLTGEIQPGVTATDVVLTVTEMLRQHGVVGKFVEFYGEGVAGGAAGQPRHPGQHESRIRFHRSDFPDRRRNHQVSAVYRSHAGAGRTGRGLRQGAGHVARSQARAGVLGIPRTQPIRRGAVDRRTKASTGPNRVGASQINIPRADLPLCRQWFPDSPTTRTRSWTR